jgi:hypothetical protein
MTKFENVLQRGIKDTTNLIRTVSELVEAAPMALEKNTNLISGVVKVSNESVPLLGETLNDVERFGKLFGDFVR